MAKFSIRTSVPVWEESAWTVDAETEEEASEKYHNGEATLDWREFGDTLEFAESVILIEKE